MHAPGLLIAAGRAGSFPLLRRLGRHFDLAERRARARMSLPRWLLSWAVAIFGLVCLGFIYLRHPHAGQRELRCEHRGPFLGFVQA